MIAIHHPNRPEGVKNRVYPGNVGQAFCARFHEIVHDALANR